MAKSERASFALLTSVTETQVLSISRRTKIERQFPSNGNKGIDRAEQARCVDHGLLSFNNRF